MVGKSCCYLCLSVRSLCFFLFLLHAPCRRTRTPAHIPRLTNSPVMSITTKSLYPPLPVTSRAQAAQLAFDSKHNRVAYANGKSIVVRPLVNADPTDVIQFTGHIYGTTAAAFSPSSNYVASGDSNGNLKIWSAEKLSLEFENPPVKSEFQVLLGPVRAITWDADGTRIIAVGEGKEKFGHCFSWDSGNSIGDIQGHSTTVTSVDIRQQRPYRAATVSEDKAMVFFNGPPFKFDKSVRGYHTNSIQGVRFLPDGAYLVSVGSDRQIVLYDGKTGEHLKSTSGHQGGIYGVSWKGNTFVTASADNTIKEWNTDLECVDTVEMPKSGKLSQQVAVAASGDKVVTVAVDGTINVIENGISTIYGHLGPITALAGDLSASSDGRILRWEGPVAHEAGSHDGYISLLVANDSHYYSAGWDDKVKKWQDGKLVAEVQLDAQPKQLVLGDQLWVVFETKVETFTLDLEPQASTEVGTTNDGDILGDGFVLTTQNTVKNLATGKELAPLRAAPTLVRVSPNGEYIAVADAAGKYILYDTDFNTVTTRWAYHSSRVLDAQWSPDSKYLASGGLDSGIFIYSVERPAKVIKRPLAHQNGVFAIQWGAYDDQNTTLVSGGADGAIKSWQVSFP